MARIVSLLGVAGLGFTAVLPRQNLPPNDTSTNLFALPDSRNIGIRAAQISDIRNNFQYGPDPVTPTGAFYPAGSYAEKMVSFDETSLFAELGPWTKVCQAEAAGAAQQVAVSGGLTGLDAYTKFYDALPNSLPGGPYAGLLSNRSSDLLFSMERLSVAPFGIKRLQPSDSLAFSVDDSVTRNITTLTQKQLLKRGLLFYFDHRDLENYPLIEGRSAAASDAFFYIHPDSQEFLPLAIRLNRGSNLMYSPADEPTDWAFAKMAFNMNNVWYEQWYHLQAVHYLIDIVFMSAVRSLSTDHPVYGILDRLSYQTFAVRLFAKTELMNDGGPIDEFFFSNGSTAGIYGRDLYFNSGAGDWLNTDFLKDLQHRNLVDPSHGPSLKHFPYFEDATVINHAIEKFVTSYVHSFYDSDSAVRKDKELAAFVAEAVPAHIINFPSRIQSRDDLIALLRHFAFTVSVTHGVINTNELSKASSLLPYHPLSFYGALPTTKGLSEPDLIKLLPNLTQSAGQIALATAFNRPWIAAGNAQGQNRTLTHMFDAPDFLARTNADVKKANEKFMHKMLDFSRTVRARGFDEKGLSQGMPFVWTVLDPEAVPFYVTI